MENHSKRTLFSLSAEQTAEKIKKREISAREVTEAYLAQIRETDDRIHAYVTVTEERALKEADAADERLASREEYPLDGLPYSLKDNIAVRNVRMTCASRLLEHYLSPYDATVTERLQTAGGVLLGKVNMDEFAMGSTTEKSFMGATANPLDHTRTAGGSSGGSAASVAAHEALFSIGTDTGGSCRQPAAYCGLVSMKPTYGTVSRYGVVEYAPSLDTVCPITKNVRDNAWLLSLLNGKDCHDMTSLDRREDYLEGIDAGVRGLRVAMPVSIDGCSEDVKRCVRRAGEILEALGATVDTVPKDVLLDDQTMLDVYYVTAMAESSSCLSRYDGIRYGASAKDKNATAIMRNTRDQFGDEVQKRILTGIYSLSGEKQELHDTTCYAAIRTLRHQLAEKSADFFRKYDVLLTPTTVDVAFPLGAQEKDEAVSYRNDRYTVFANLVGTPSVQIPGGGNGILPCGILLTGGRFSERLLYRAAYALEQELTDMIRAEVAAR